MSKAQKKAEIAEFRDALQEHLKVNNEEYVVASHELRLYDRGETIYGQTKLENLWAVRLGAQEMIFHIRENLKEVKSVDNSLHSVLEEITHDLELKFPGT